MSVKHYGIYLAYPPTVDLRAAGLGRHLAQFLKGAEDLPDLNFTIICPSWSHNSLEQLFQSENVDRSKVSIQSPRGKPYVLRLYEALSVQRDHGLKSSRWKRCFKALSSSSTELLRKRFERCVTAIHDIPTQFILIIELLLLTIPVVLALLLRLTFLCLHSFAQLFRSTLFKVMARLGLNKIMTVMATMIAIPKNDAYALRLLEQMQKIEERRMLQLINALEEIKAWYCPTAFWPTFNHIKAPCLLCVPDVVLTDFPIGFSSVGGDRYLHTFETIGCTIRGARNFVTYSQSVKWDTLVDRYGVSPSKVTVIHHAPNRLDCWVNAADFPDPEATSRHCYKTLLYAALQKNYHPAYTSNFGNKNIEFLFYASQFRPNKNLITLLQAYKYLLRQRHIGHKLILTGHFESREEIKRFIVDHNLGNDVLCLHGLSVPELAACYKLAALAVNPSLSEGGCPFTFTEALSVGTPVVMAKIPVTEEILFEPQLQEVSLFDPYDWKDMAHRIEWALQNKETLLKIQTTVYQRLIKRTWTDVVREHIAVLEQLSNACFAKAA